MIINYQIILIGKKHPLESKILESLQKHLTELGIAISSVINIYEANFLTHYKSNAPAFCLYFGDSTRDFKSLDILKRLISDGTLIVPVVSDIELFSSQIPDVLLPINGFELSSENRIESLSNLILEGLGLLRISRRIFISYKRRESSAVAMQLYEHLEKNGFDVFLDTHSVRPGEPFQDELWHRLADSDVVVLLNTPGFLTSQWTKEELARANAMQIGILQLIWPSHKMEVSSAISIPIQLNDSDFLGGKFLDQKSYLIDLALSRIVQETENLRARSLAARQDNLITEFVRAAEKNGKPTHLQPQKYIQTKKKNGDNVIIIPTVGIPQAFNYNKSQDSIDALNFNDRPEIWLLYDHINIRDHWLKHLDWLDKHLPLKTLRITKAELWLQKN